MTRPPRLRLRTILLSFLWLAACAPVVPAAAYKPPESIPDWIESIRSAETRFGERWSVHVEDLNGGGTVFEYNPELRLAPASCRKIVTSALALEYLGSDYQFQTVLGLDAAPPAANAASPEESAHYRGNLVLRAAGDPSFGGPLMREPRNPFDLFDQWARKLTDMGIRHIHGDLVLDASAFGADQNAYPEVWEPRHRMYAYAPVASALAVNQNALTISVRPGAKSGHAGQVRVFPSLEGIALDNKILTRSRGVSGISAAFADDLRTVELTGRMKIEDRQEVVILPLARPIEYLGENLVHALESNGVELTGGMRVMLERGEGVAPTPLIETLGAHDSPPLNRILVSMIRNSNNFMAEQIWFATASRVAGRADRATARRIEQRWLRSIGLNWIEAGWDGSGLSRQTTLSARELTLIMRYVHRSAYRDVLVDALPISGRQGTLRNRSFTPRGGRVQAKTGTLAGVSSLTGYIRDKSGEPRLVFAVIGNAPGDTDGRLAMRINELMKLLIEDLDAGRLPARASAMAPAPAFPPSLHGG